MASDWTLPKPGDLGYIEQIKSNAMAIEDLAKILKIAKRFDNEESAKVNIRFWLDSCAAGESGNGWQICPLCLKGGKSPRESNTCLKKPVIARGDYHPASPEVLNLKGKKFVLDRVAGEFNSGDLVEYPDPFIGCPECISMIRNWASSNEYAAPATKLPTHHDGSLIRFVGWTNWQVWADMSDAERGRHSACGAAGKCVCPA